MSKKILLVEDEPLIAMHEARMLEKHGYEVVTVHNGEEAVEKANSDSEISLILMDIDLGKGIDGTEAAEKILEKHDLPIAFLSSHTEAEIVERTEGITSYGYIVKNSGETVIIASVKMAFRLFEAHQELKKQKEKLNDTLIKYEQTAEELEDKNEELERYFNSSLDMLCIADTQGTFIRLNPEWEKVLGYSVDELEGSSFLDFVHPEDREPTLQAVAKLDSGDKVENFENRFRCRDGSYRWIEWRSRPFESTIYAAARDITERKEAEKGLWEREALYRNLMENSIDGVELLDEDGNYLNVNQKECEMLGYSREELLNMKIADIDPNYPKDGFYQFWKKQPKGSSVLFETTHRHKDGTLIPVEVNGIFFIVGNKKYIFGVARDIRDRKKAEHEIKTREENLRITLNSIGDAVISTDIDGNIVRMNPEAEKITGWAIKDAKGKRLNKIFRIINAYSRQIVDNPVEKVIESGEVVGLGNHTVLISKDGTEYQIADSAAPIRDDSGRISGVVLVFRDVTGDYEKERQLKERIKELRCLYQISKIEGNKGLSLDEILKKIVKIIPDAMQYPEISACRITFKDKKYESKAFKETNWKLSSNVIIYGEVPGAVEVYYLKKMPAVDEGPFLKEERELLETAAEQLERIIERKQSEEELRSIEWMLSHKTEKQDGYTPEYGDLSKLNKDGLILHSVGKEQLQDIASEYLDLLETSTAVYEKDGSYALGLFTSGWCRLMDSASRRLCNTEDNREALESGKWLCHESCWNDAALSMEKDAPVEIECNGGIRMYAVPIHANGEIVGAVNFGYGTPPIDEAELNHLAEKYKISVDKLKQQAKTYRPRPQYLIDYAKKRLQVAAKNIGRIIEREQQKKELEQERVFLTSVLDTIKEAIIICDASGKISRFNEEARRLHGIPEKPIPSDRWAEYYDLYPIDGNNPLPKEDVPLFRAFNGEDVKNTEIIVKPKNGQARLLTCNGRQLLDYKGEKIGAVIAMHDITEYKQAENSLRNTLKEKDFLMGELNHRVKNNLNMVASLISLKETEMESDLSDIRHQINAISLIHQKLYQTKNLKEIYCRDYIEDLLKTIFSSFTQRAVRVDTDIDDMYIPTKKAISLGLIINEIATNAVKHGFTGKEEAVFSITMKKDNENNCYELTLSNTGNPFPEDIDIENTDTLGLRLINSLVAQIDGRIELQKKPNPVFTIRIAAGGE